MVDAALAITGAERGFLLLRKSGELETRVARNRHGATLPDSDLRVPRRVIKRALEQRRDLLSMNFDPQAPASLQPRTQRGGPGAAQCDLACRWCASARCSGDATNMLSTGSETVGVLYMDSRLAAADLAGGNRELLQTLAIEASTILENARLLEEERAKQKMEEELNVARTIQQGLLPRSLPADGWFRACGSSVASHQVGGDYFDVTRAARGWTAVVADVSGKGVSSALLASLLQGACSRRRRAGSAEAPHGAPQSVPDRAHRRREIRHRLLLPAGRGRAAALCECGALPAADRAADGRLSDLDATAMPVGLVEGADFEVADDDAGSGRQDRDLHRWRHRSAERAGRVFRQEAAARGRGGARGASPAARCTTRFRKRWRRSPKARRRRTILRCW